MVDIKATRRVRATKNFFKKAKVVHGDKYDYSKVNYIDAVTKVIIICKIHGEFLQQPGKHINSGCGCKQCVYAALRKSTKSYDEELVLKKEGTITRIGKYINSHTPIKHQHTCGHIWKVSPSALFKGNGCPACASYGFNPMKPAILYYIKVCNKDNIAYKIGITNNTVAKRYAGEMQFITTLKTWHYEVGADAYRAEQDILALNTEFKYTGVPLLKRGNTELFYKDIGEFDE